VSAYVPGIDERDLKKLILSLQQLAAGRSNAVGTVTLTASAATTTVNDDNCAAASVPILTPMTAHASAEVGAGTIYISDVANKSFTITHASNSQTDRIFLYALVG
jgi:hypothetical protein